MSIADQTKASRKQIITWCMWDAGGASVNAVATTFVFSVYLATAAFGDPTHSTEMISTGMMIAGVIVALTAPITGQRADRTGKGTRWLGVFSYIVIASLAAMFFIKPDPSFLIPGVALLVIMTVFFEFASVNYYAMLNRVSDRTNVGRISGIGWASGYFGGIILLLVLMQFFIKEDNLLGIDTANGMGVRTAMLAAAVWAALFFTPVLFAVPGRVVPGAEDAKRESYISSYRKLFKTIMRLAKEAPSTLYFLVASAIFRDGLTGVFTFGGLIAAVTFGFTPGEVILFAIAANVIAGISTAAIGYVDDWLGPKKVMVISLLALTATCIAVFFLHDRGKIIMWTFGLFLTVWVGPAQSASRTFLARRIPPGHEGEIYGLYQTTGRAATPLAPAMFAFFIWIGRTVEGGGETQVQHWGILGIGLILLVGLLLLLPVNEKNSHLFTHASAS